MRQIFDGNRALRAFGLRNNPFGENVVDVFSESGFLSGKDAQAATAPQRAVPLELVAQAPVTIAHVLDRPPAVDFPITIDGDVRHAQIDAQHIVNINRAGASISQVANTYQYPRTKTKSLSPRRNGNNARCRSPHTKGIAARPSIVQIETDESGMANERMRSSNATAPSGLKQSAHPRAEETQDVALLLGFRA